MKFLALSIIHTFFFFSVKDAEQVLLASFYMLRDHTTQMKICIQIMARWVLKFVCFSPLGR